MIRAVRFPAFLGILRGNIGNGWSVVLVLSLREPCALPPLVGEKESVEVSAFSGGAVRESDNITAYQGHVMLRESRLSLRLGRKGCVCVQAGVVSIMLLKDWHHPKL